MSTSALSVSQLFDSVGKPYEIAFDNVPGQQRSLQWLLETLPPGSRILDIGSGTGKPASELLAAARHAVLGIDISPIMVATASAQVPAAQFQLADTKTWEPASGDGSFDAVVAYFSVIADYSQAEIRDFFTRVGRWVKKGGVFVFGTVLIDGDLIQGRWMGREAVVSGLSLEGNLKAIKAAGFVVEKYENEKFLPRGEEAGLCRKEDVWEEDHLFVYARK